MIEWLQNVDSQLLIYLNNLGSDSYDNFWLYMSDQNTWIPVYIMFLFILIAQYPKKQLLLIIICISISFFCTDFIVHEFIKPAVGRPRPCSFDSVQMYLRIVQPECRGRYSFFSQHASNSFGFAVLMGKILHSQYKYVLPLLLIWASLVAYSRVYVGVHYPLDILVGSLYGSLVAYWVYKLIYRKYLPKIILNKS